MDNLAYNYNKTSGRLTSNKLNYITDAVTTQNWPYGLNNQANNNYTYDAIGNMTADIADTISSINWTVYNKIQSLTNSKGTITYTYDPEGQRVSKTLNGITTWYIRDAQGNTLALYDNKHGTTNWKEQDLYGSSRLGMWQPGVTLSTNNATAVWDTIGNKEYELSNHLGNVLATISDKRVQHSSNGTAIDYFDADIATAQEYYAFGGLMPGRTYVQASNYRYGFNGKENDNDANNGFQDYGQREYDRLTGRFVSVDPISVKYPELSSYQFASNSPIQAVDLDGEEKYNYNIVFDKGGKARLSFANTEDIIDHSIKFTSSFPFVKLVEEVNQRQEFVVHGQTTRTFDNMGNIVFYQDEDEKTFSTIAEATKNVKKNNGLGYVYNFSHQLAQGGMYIAEEERTGGAFSGMMKPAGEASSLRENISSKSSEVVNIEVTMMEGWTPEQQTAARNKIADINAMDPTVVEKIPVREKNLRNLYKKAGGEVSSTQDVDHILDLQLGGTNDFSNLQGLDQSVNRSLGSQIQSQIKNLTPGTKVNITIKGP